MVDCLSRFGLSCRGGTLSYCDGLGCFCLGCRGGTLSHCHGVSSLDLHCSDSSGRFRPELVFEVDNNLLLKVVVVLLLLLLVVVVVVVELRGPLSGFPVLPLSVAANRSNRRLFRVGQHPWPGT